MFGRRRIAILPPPPIPGVATLRGIVDHQRDAKRVMECKSRRGHSFRRAVSSQRSGCCPWRRSPVWCHLALQSRPHRGRPRAHGGGRCPRARSAPTSESTCGRVATLEMSARSCMRRRVANVCRRSLRRKSRILARRSAGRSTTRSYSRASSASGASMRGKNYGGARVGPGAPQAALRRWAPSASYPSAGGAGALA
jgi:hypothetical protein